jgi:hypothetical protein
MSARSRRDFESINDFENWLDKIAPDRLSRQKAFRGGNWAALYDAALQTLVDDDKRRRGALKADDEVPVPRWVLEALIELLEQFLPNAKSKGKARGRHSRWREQYPQDQIDWERFHQVWYRKLARRDDSPPHPSRAEAKLRRQQFPAEAVARKTPHAIQMHTPYPWIAGKDDRSVFEAAACVLAGTVYGGSASALMKSYQRVLDALRRGEIWRYYPSKRVRFARQFRNRDTDSAS